MLVEFLSCQCRMLSLRTFVCTMNLAENNNRFECGLYYTSNAGASTTVISIFLQLVQRPTGSSSAKLTS